MAAARDVAIRSLTTVEDIDASSAVTREPGNPWLPRSEIWSEIYDSEPRTYWIVAEETNTKE